MRQSPGFTKHVSSLRNYFLPTPLKSTLALLYCQPRSFVIKLLAICTDRMQRFDVKLCVRMYTLPNYNPRIRVRESNQQAVVRIDMLPGR